MVLLQKVINDIEFAFWIFRHRRTVRLTEIIRNTSARGDENVPKHAQRIVGRGDLHTFAEPVS